VAALKMRFFSDLPVRTFLIAYGQKSKIIGNKKNKNKITAFGTPFIKSGLTHKVPEPSTLLLFGIGLLGLGFFFRNYFTK
jgi:hypothetical protein